MAPTTLDELDHQFAIADAVGFHTPPHGATIARLSGAGGSAEIALHGAHVLAFRPAGTREVLWLSPRARFEPDKAIRGGIPICWPWFGPHPSAASAPAHGLARHAPWTVRRTSREADRRVRMDLDLEPNSTTQGLWPKGLAVGLTVTVGTALELALTSTNRAPEPLTLSEALHTYFAVSDVREVAIHGLDGVDYLDKVDAMARKTQRGAVHITEETDRVYLGTEAACTLADPGWQRRIVVSKSGSRSTVVWNPWAAKARAMADFPDNGYLGMVCVETANAEEDALTLQPGEAHTLLARIGVETG
jgi:D-hexose-6-phosphate mutarotase